MNKKVLTAFNDQFNLEYESSYLYLSMASYCEAEGYNGIANWMKQQSKEELAHAMKFWGFIFESNETVTLGALNAPKAKWTSIKAVFEASLAHEEKVSKSIDDLINLSIQNKSHAAHHFLLGFATEQIEEENTVRDILRKIQIIGNNPMGVLMLDKELGGRVQH